MFSAETFLPAAIIGTNSPALPLTAERIAELPKDKQPAWRKYLARSERQLQADQKFLFNEMKSHGLKESLLPPAGNSGSRLSLKQPGAWYGQAEARRIADIVVSFQTPAGGWTKGLDLTQHRRAPGEGFTRDNLSRFLSKFDNDTPRDVNWN